VNREISSCKREKYCGDHNDNDNKMSCIIALFHAKIQDKKTNGIHKWWWWTSLFIDQRTWQFLFVCSSSATRKKEAEEEEENDDDDDD